MRILALILVLVVLLAGAFIGYCYYGAQMRIEGVGMALTPAGEAIGTYSGLLEQLENESFAGVVYHRPDFATADDFAFLTLAVRMGNRGVLPMDWIELAVQPGMADILQLPADRTPSLAPGTRGDFSTTLLTRAGADTARTITVTYYVMGTQYSKTFETPAQ